MAGLDDYQFYTNLKEKDSPFWQKVEKQFPSDDKENYVNRPSTFPTQLTNTDSPFDKNKLSLNAAYEKEGPQRSDDPYEKYGDISFTLISICAENLLSHPFIVLKRQCQVNVSSQRYHLQPFTLIPALIHLQGHQGLSVLWKGLGSVLTVRGITMGLEDCLSKFTPWPKEISPHSSLKTIGQHLLLKCSAIALITPFYSASLVETVQSEITSERPGVLDVFKEGLCRLLSFTQPQTGRMLPVWLLIVPTVVHGVLQYVIGNITSTITSQILRNLEKRNQKKKGALAKDASLSDALIRLQSAYVGHLVADIILFPLETILHRLHLQGTRTIIDSLDVGYEVKPILTRYEGFFDCLSTTTKDEGVLGFFKGYGALCLQYFIYGAALKFAHIIIREIKNILAPPLPKIKQQEDVQFTSSYPFDTEEHMTPLTPGAPYTSIPSLHSGVSSLHSSPLHSSRNRGQQQFSVDNRLYHTGSVDLGDLTSIERESPLPFRGRQNIDLKAEMERHKATLSQQYE